MIDEREPLGNMEQEAETARMMVEAEGGKAFVLIAKVTEAQDGGYHVDLVRGISDRTTAGHGRAWVAALQREIDRVNALLAEHRP